MWKSSYSSNSTGEPLACSCAQTCRSLGSNDVLNCRKNQVQFLIQEDRQRQNFAVSVFLGILSVPIKCTLPMNVTVSCFQWRFRVLRPGLLCLIGSQQSSFGKGARPFGKLADSSISLCSKRFVTLTLMRHVAVVISVGTADSCLMRSSSKAIPSRLLQVALLHGWLDFEDRVLGMVSVCSGSVDFGSRRTTKSHRGRHALQARQLRKFVTGTYRNSTCHHLPDGSKTTAKFVDSTLARLMSLLQMLNFSTEK